MLMPPIDLIPNVFLVYFICETISACHNIPNKFLLFYSLLFHGDLYFFTKRDFF